MADTTNKLGRGNVTILAIYPEYVTFDAPVTAELNGAVGVFNISCAVEDGYTLNQSASETDDSMSVCDVSQVSSPTLRNYEASLDGFRDRDVDANGVYNTFFHLFKRKGLPFVLVKRVGKPNNAPFAVNDIVSLYGVVTDNPQNIVEENAPIRLGARFKRDGRINPEYKLEA